MALQGRKPGWLLDKILGRQDPSAPEPNIADLTIPESSQVEPATVQKLVPLPPAYRPDGQPDLVPMGAPEGIAPEPPREPDRPDQAASGGGAGRRRASASGRAAGLVAAARHGPAGWCDGCSTKPGSGGSADGMRRTSSKIGDSVTSLFTKRKLDRATLDDLEDVLIGADLGIETATRITGAIAGGRYDREISAHEVKAIMAAEIEAVLRPVARPLVIESGRKPFVLLVVGVNGAGKTTTIGKLAQKFRHQGMAVTIAAGDTFRAAAIEQLKVWGERVGAPVIARAQGADPAGLAFDALEEARGRGADVLMIDTAGRLQNKAGLMAELEKIVRAVRKIDPEAPHATLLVLDATVGQNALSQVELFAKTAGVTGLVMTKLDGTARGGILVALAAKFGLPVHFIGVGEGVDDLEPFEARDFARAIAGLDEAS